jgi:hypothetical protein
LICIKAAARQRGLYAPENRMREPHDTTIRYPTEDGVALIEIRLNTVNQLFNALDPAPFREKDLDADAEEYIVGAVDDFPLSAPLKIVFYLPPAELRALQVDLAEVIHHYFDYALAKGRRKLRFDLREGRISLLIGLAFLFACISLRQLVQSLDAGTFGQIAAEGLLISGWVAMWRPIHIFLYGWWPTRHLCRVFAKLQAMPVQVRPHAAAPAREAAALSP